MSRFPNDPTGRVETSEEGRRLIIERTFDAPIREVWASLAEPAGLARWYGTLQGEVGPGRTVTITLTAEAEPSALPVLILECDPPNRYVIDVLDPGPPWHLSVDLSESDGVTTLEFVHVLGDADVSDIGPGWEFYADRLTAAREGGEMPDWDADGYLEKLGPSYRSL